MAASLSIIAAKDGNGTAISGSLQALDLSGAGTGPWSLANILVDGVSGTLRAAVTAANALKVDGSAVTQPVSGTVTANAGTNMSTASLALETGGNLATIAGAVTSSVVQANLKQVNGITTLAGAGASGTGAQRVTVSQDTTTVAGSAPGTAGTASTNVVSIQGIAAMTPVQVSQATAANLNATVVGTGTFAVQAAATLNAETTKVIGTVRNVGNGGGVFDFAGQNAAQPANALLIGGEFNTAPTTITTGNASPLQLDSAGNLLVNIKAGAGSGGTALADEAAFTEGTTSFTPIGGVFKTSQTALTTGQAGAVALSAAREMNTLGKVWDGTNTAAVKAASTAPLATDPAFVVAISPNSVNANGRAVPANSAPVVMASQAYNTVAASQTAQALTGGSGGATGDWLDFLLIIPATTAAGAVSIKDGAGSSITVWAGGGTTALVSLVPFPVPIRAISAAGAWSVTTGANVSVIATGNFH